MMNTKSKGNPSAVNKKVQYFSEKPFYDKVPVNKFNVVQDISGGGVSMKDEGF